MLRFTAILELDMAICEILKEYRNKLDGWKDNIQLNGKNIEVANIEQASFIAYYDEIRMEVKSILDFYSGKIKQVRGEVYREILKTSTLTHTERAIDRIIDSSTKVIKYSDIYIEVKEIYNICDCIIESFKSRGFALNNIVKIRIAELENINLYE